MRNSLASLNCSFGSYGNADVAARLFSARDSKAVFFKRLIENALFPRPHRSFGRLRDEPRRQGGMRIGGIQRVPEGRGRCRGGVKKRITFIGRRRRTSQTAARESPRSLCIARSQDVRPASQLSVYDASFPWANKDVKSVAGILPESYANCFAVALSFL